MSTTGPLSPVTFFVESLLLSVPFSVSVKCALTDVTSSSPLRSASVFAVFAWLSPLIAESIDGTRAMMLMISAAVDMIVLGVRQDSVCGTTELVLSSGESRASSASGW
ncbi:hypothetical protein Y717_25680 [Streptomyces scopuliridis RB72]|uniref:Uncharacterized protein n=1 Tax=Streptomyces scopuliridis RB72 TaxID=1440053 RepID=A0A2T7SWE4_9ACTN|nr:hypothetical protein Y717_25680 [Streptomyces scopuliridis RB72]